MDDDDEQRDFIYSKRLRRHVPIDKEREAAAAAAAANQPCTSSSGTDDEEVTKIARPIPIHHSLQVASAAVGSNRWLYPPVHPPSSTTTPAAAAAAAAAAAYLYQPSGLLSHHGFTPPRVQYEVPPRPLVNHQATSSSSATILISPDVELTRVTPSAYTIILSESRTPLAPPPPPPQPPPPLHEPVARAILESPTSSSDQPAEDNDQTRAPRRKKPDDLVPPGCGLSRDDIVCLPIDDFNDKVADKPEEQILVLKDRRRRGKKSNSG